jgi:hypothetical protein
MTIINKYNNKKRNSIVLSSLLLEGLAGIITALQASIVAPALDHVKSVEELKALDVTPEQATEELKILFKQ